MALLAKGLLIGICALSLGACAGSKEPAAEAKAAPAVSEAPQNLTEEEQILVNRCQTTLTLSRPSETVTVIAATAKHQGEMARVDLRYAADKAASAEQARVYSCLFKREMMQSSGTLAPGRMS